ncbi:MAG: flavodoxin family protein [Gemmatimonadota bacterium]
MADTDKMLPRVRKQQGSVQLSREEFSRRFRERFYDPSFEQVAAEIARVEEVAWKNYDEYHKSPRTRRAGEEFADANYELPVEWLEARHAIQRAETRHQDAASPRRILLISGAARHDQTCPGETPKTYRLIQIAREVVESSAGFECDLLDLSLLSAEYGKRILPCKSCVATAMPLCHWPCSCYPNHAMDQTQDWMNQIYPRWVAAHGIMIVTPVYWYQAPSTLKLMMDRLVCADGGNPDLTTTHGKKVEEAKALELKGWHYPRHLAGRLFAIVVHGDTEGADIVSRSLGAWLEDMDLIPAAPSAVMDRYIGYYEPYATSHESLDRDTAVQEEVRNVARTLVRAVELMRDGRFERADRDVKWPRPK